MNQANHRRAAMLTLILLALSPYFIRLGASSVWDSNEAFYAETPREMIESGDYVNPSFNYQPRFNKPPLSYWVVVLFYNLFGISEAIERLAIVLAAIAMIATAWLMARSAFGNGAGLLAAAGFAASPRLLMFSRRIMVDYYLSTFMSLALLFFALAQSKPERRRTWLALMYASIGLGLMTKGPVAALLPAVSFSLYLVVTRQLGMFRRMMVPAGVLIVALIVVPWHAAVYFQHGPEYIKTFLLKDNLSRYAEYSWGPERGLFFYVRVLFGDLFPLSVLLAPALWFAARRPKRLPATTAAAATANIPLLFVIWLGVIVIFFSLSKSKEDLYIMPAYPAAAALAGGLAASLIRNQATRGVQIASRTILAAGGLLLAAAGGTALYLFADPTSPYVVAGTSLIGPIAIAGGLTVMIAGAWGRIRLALIALAGSLYLSNWVFVLLTLPDFERYKPVAALCNSIQQTAPGDSLVGYYRYASPSMVFYLRRQIFEYYEPKQLRLALLTGKPVFCVISEEDYFKLRDSLPIETYILASRPIFRVKLKSILDRVQPPQVLLITNGVEQSVTQ